MATIVHVGDIGTIFRLTIVDEDGDAIDVSGATTKKIYFEKPDRTKIVRTATFYTDGSDGIIQYAVVDGDLNKSGDWQVQGWVDLADGEFFSALGEFTVRETIYTAS